MEEGSDQSAPDDGEWNPHMTGGRSREQVESQQKTGGLVGTCIILVALVLCAVTIIDLLSGGRVWWS
jgi:hypothetical protein